MGKVVTDECEYSSSFESSEEKSETFKEEDQQL